MMRFFKNRNFWYVIGILAAAAVVLWPLTKPGFIVTDDGDWMVIRLSAFFQSLREGQFPVRFLGRLNYGYGYPVANFLYPGFLYLGSFIHAFGISFPDTVKTIIAGSVVVSTLVIFGWLRKHFSSRSSFIGSLSFLFAPYLFFDIYKRGSVGEVLAFVPAVLGFYAIDSKKYWLMPLAVSFLILSHNSLALLFSVVLVAYILLKREFFLFIPFLLGLGLATFFWFPALFERRYVVFDEVLVAQSTKYLIEGAQVVLFGLSGVAAVSLLLVVGNKLRRSQFIFFVTVFVASVILATPLTGFLWQNVWFSKLFQFPSRFLAISLTTGAWLVSYVMELYARKHTGKLIIFFAVLWVAPLVSFLGTIKIANQPLGFYTTNEATTTVSDEYMPRWVTIKPTSHPSQKIVFYKGHGTVKQTTSSTQHIEAEIEAREDSVIQINSIYYPGWGATVDNQWTPLSYQNPRGVIQIPVTRGKHKMLAEFRETIPRFAADMVSLICIFLTLIYVSFGLRGKSAPFTPKLR